MQRVRREVLGDLVRCITAAALGHVVFESGTTTRLEVAAVRPLEAVCHSPGGASHWNVVDLKPRTKILCHDSVERENRDRCRKARGV